MPSMEPVYERITLRMAWVLSLMARHHTYREIAETMGIAERTVENEVQKAENATALGHDELARWWLDHRLRWAAWVLARLGIDPKEFVS